MLSLWGKGGGCFMDKGTCFPELSLAAPPLLRAALALLQGLTKSININAC